jgi:hypothetical protein
MDEWLARLLMVIEGVGIICLTGFAAYWMKLRHQRRLAADLSMVARLQQELEDLRSLTQAQISELQERVDFADRVLTQQKLPQLEESETETPV